MWVLAAMPGPGQALRRRDTPVQQQGARALADAAADASKGVASDGTVIDRLTAVQNGRLGRLLNQLQVFSCALRHPLHLDV